MKEDQKKAETSERDWKTAVHCRGHPRRAAKNRGDQSRSDVSWEECCSEKGNGVERNGTGRKEKKKGNKDRKEGKGKEKKGWNVWIRKKSRGGEIRIRDKRKRENISCTMLIHLPSPCLSLTGWGSAAGLLIFWCWLSWSDCFPLDGCVAKRSWRNKFSSYQQSQIKIVLVRS